MHLLCRPIDDLNQLFPPIQTHHLDPQSLCIGFQSFSINDHLPPKPFFFNFDIFLPTTTSTTAKQ